MTQAENIEKQSKPLKKKRGISNFYYLNKNDPMYIWVCKKTVISYEFRNELSDCFVKN